MKKLYSFLVILLFIASGGCRTTEEESDVESLRPKPVEKPSGDIVGPNGVCSTDINEFGFPSACGCPNDYFYSMVIGKCTLGTRICSKALVSMYHPPSGKCREAGDGCTASDWATEAWRRKDANDTCSVQTPPGGNSSKKVSGFDFTGLKVLDAAPANQMCPSVVNAEEQACLAAGGTNNFAKGCAVLCSTPIAKKGKVAGFNFAGPRIAAAMAANTVCPQLANAETDACIAVNGDTRLEKGCKVLCSKPIAKKGNVAGFDFTGFKTAPALAPNMFCAQAADAVTDACVDASADTTYTKGCGVLCSVPIAR